MICISYAQPPPAEEDLNLLHVAAKVSDIKVVCEWFCNTNEIACLSRGKQRNAGNTKRKNQLEGWGYKNKRCIYLTELKPPITNVNISFIRGLAEQNLSQQASVRTSRLAASMRKLNVSLAVMKNNKCVKADLIIITQQTDLKMNFNPGPPVTWQEIKPP